MIQLDEELFGIGSALAIFRECFAYFHDGYDEVGDNILHGSSGMYTSTINECDVNAWFNRVTFRCSRIRYILKTRGKAKWESQVKLFNQYFCYNLRRYSWTVADELMIVILHTHLFVFLKRILVFDPWLFAFSRSQEELITNTNEYILKIERTRKFLWWCRTLNWKKEREKKTKKKKQRFLRAVSKERVASIFEDVSIQIAPYLL